MDTLVRSFCNKTRLFSCAEDFLNSGLIAETSLLISDIMMPGMSGVAMLECIRQLEYAPPT
ncbi:response regulator, partial [Paraburkholderia steynii]